jgi:hypothetical protein
MVRRQVNPRQILLTAHGQRWLEQFDAADREAARRLVAGLTLVSHSAFDRALDRLIREQAASVNGAVALFAAREVDPSESYFVQAATEQQAEGVDAVGRGPDIGSEGRVAGLLRNMARSDPTKFLNHPTVHEMRDAKCKGILVADDLIGSGERTAEFLHSIWQDRTIRSWRSFGYLKHFLAVAYAGTPTGIRVVEKTRCKPRVEIDRESPTFDKLPWTPDLREQVADLCRKYASCTSEPRAALGYRRTMAAIVFEHGCPDNVPAILWASRENGHRWHGLFPGRTVPPAEKSAFPANISQQSPSELLHDAGQARLARADLFSKRNRPDTNTLMVLALVAKRVRETGPLSFATGLSNHECARLLEKCIASDFLTNTLRLTATGRAELDHARRRRSIDVRVPQKGEECYHPQQLRRATGG